MLDKLKSLLSPPSEHPDAETEHRKLKISAVVSVAAAVFILLFLLLCVVIPDRGFSANENRNLAGRASFSVDGLRDGSFFKDVTDHFSDQFFLRDSFVSLRSAEEYLLGSRISHGVYIGSDNYLFADPETPDPAKQKSLVEAMSSFASQFENVSIRMMLVPCAAAVIPDRLPPDAPVRDQLRDISDLAAALPQSVSFVDAASVLQAHSGDQLYYRTDHHWTGLGAKTVFDNTASQLGIDNPSTEYDCLPLSYTFLGTLGSQSGRYGTRDKIEVYVPKPGVLYYISIPDEQVTRSSIYDLDKLNEKDQYQVFLGGNHPVVEIRTAARTGKNLMLFKDSYANSFVQFLIPYYDRIIMVDPRYYYDNPSTLIRSNGITDILFLYSANTLFTDNSLTDCLVNAVS